MLMSVGGVIRCKILTRRLYKGRQSATEIIIIYIILYNYDVLRPVTRGAGGAKPPLARHFSPP